MLQFHLFGWISSYLTRPGFATIKYWIELYWQYIGLFGGLARIPLQAPGFSRVYSGSIYNDTRDPFFFPSLSWWFVPPPINPKGPIGPIHLVHASGWWLPLGWPSTLQWTQHRSDVDIACDSNTWIQFRENSKAGKIMISWKRWIKVMTLVTTTFWV